MRHLVKKHLHLSPKDNAHRKSVIRNLLTGLFTHKSVHTTEKLALAMEPLAHRLIEMAKGDHTEYNKIRFISAELFTNEASTSLMEALSAGCAVITSDISGCPETVGEAGICVPPADTPLLKVSIKKLINFLIIKLHLELIKVRKEIAIKN